MASFYSLKKYLGNNISTLKEFENSEYIGLSAGHVIGERGTQLSMQTFHTGKKRYEYEHNKFQDIWLCL